MEIKSSEFFRNIKVLPDPDSSEFQQLVDWEIDKCMGGVNVNRVFISGWLYWHLNHWHINMDSRDIHGNSIRIEGLPTLRDNEWIRAENLERCRKEQKGYFEVGARQTAKSELEASFCGYNSILFQNTQNIIVGGNNDDINLLKNKLDLGLKTLWKGISIPRLDKTWKSNTIRLGYKLPNGDDNVWSYLIIRNADEGNNTEVAAGTTAKSFIMDEVGKYLFGKVYEAAKPALKSDDGWRAVPIMVGTGGSFDRGADAERFFYNPEANDFLGIKDVETGKITGLFLSGLYRKDCKYKMDLATYLIQENKLEPGEYPELAKIEILVSDKEKARKKIEEDREKKKKDPDQSEYLKVIMYDPLTPDECFLSQSHNIFNVTSAKAQKLRLQTEGITGTNVFLEHDGEHIKHILTDKRPISKFPHNHSDDKDAPIVIWEFPIKDVPFGLYTCGVDSYKFADSDASPSLGSVYIFKRIHNIFDEKFQNMMVASYAARPEDKMKWNEQARLLIKFYNARTLVENDEMSFIDYMISKGDAKYLEPEPQYLKSFVKNSTVHRPFGIHRSADAIRNHLHETFKLYMSDIIKVERDEQGSVIKEISGIHRILDPVLLDEVAKYSDNGPIDNFDRVVAFELALSLADYLNRSIRIDSVETDSRVKSYFNKKKGNSVFSSMNNIFGSKKNKVF